MHATVRVRLVDGRWASLGVRLEPGLTHWALGPPVLVVPLSVSLEAGLHPRPALTVLLGLEARPMVVNTWWAGAGALSVLVVNPGFELRLTDRAALTLRTAIGPNFPLGPYGVAVNGMSAEALLGTAVRF